MHFSVSLPSLALLCVWLCMHVFMFFFFLYFKQHLTPKNCSGVGGGVTLVSCAPRWSRQTAELPVTISNPCFLLFLISGMSHLLQQNTHTPKGLRLSYSISLVPLISNPPKNTFCPPIPPSLQC